MRDQGEGATPALITEHAFEPDGDWFQTCSICGLAECVHTTTTLCRECGGHGGSVVAGNCDRCQGTGIDPTSPKSPL